MSSVVLPGPYGLAVRNKMVRCKEPSTCSICLKNVPVKTFLMRLPCGHTFHASCVNKWFQNKKYESCPLCRHVHLFKFFHAVDPYHNGTYHPTIRKTTRVGRARVVVRNDRHVRSLFNCVILELRLYIKQCWYDNICFCHNHPNLKVMAEATKLCWENYLGCVESVENYFYIMP